MSLMGKTAQARAVSCLSFYVPTRMKRRIVCQTALGRFTENILTERRNMAVYPVSFLSAWQPH